MLSEKRAFPPTRNGQLSLDEEDKRLGRRLNKEREPRVQTANHVNQPFFDNDRGENEDRMRNNDRERNFGARDRNNDIKKNKLLLTGKESNYNYETPAKKNVRR